jgi:hypothetical protein
MKILIRYELNHEKLRTCHKGIKITHDNCVLGGQNLLCFLNCCDIMNPWTNFLLNPFHDCLPNVTKYIKKNQFNKFKQS